MKVQKLDEYYYINFTITKGNYSQFGKLKNKILDLINIWY